MFRRKYFMEKLEFNKNTKLKIQPTYLTLHYSPLYYFTSQLAHYGLALDYKHLARSKEAKQLVHRARAEEVWKSFRTQKRKVTETEKDQQSASRSEKATKKF